jgi:hypothetical protein
VKDGTGGGVKKRRDTGVGGFLFLIIPSNVLCAFLVKPASVKFSVVAMSTIVKDLEDENTDF